MKTKTLPFGVCRTFFFNPLDREVHDPSNRRPCFVAYHGCREQRTYKSKRFPIDTFGEKKALTMAKNWRSLFAPLDKRSCDVVRKRRK